jgi:nitrite reductase/ring-hydroxylating ferredoxin subunit
MNDSSYICAIDEINDPGSRGFSVEYGEKLIQGFIVQKDGQLFAYINQCPHTGAPLDWVEHQFLDADLALIQCAVHDARFQIENGVCVSGPCAGNSLHPLAIKERDKKIYLAVEP